MLVGPVADAEDDDVALVALDVLEVLDEHAVETSALEERREPRLLAARILAEDLVDERGLCLVECDDADAALTAFRVPEDAVGDGVSLDGVVPRRATAIHAVDADLLDAEIVRRLCRAREGHEVAAIETQVREGDEVLVSRPVMPAQRQRAERTRGLGEVQNGVELGKGVLGPL